MTRRAALAVAAALVAAVHMAAPLAADQPLPEPEPWIQSFPGRIAVIADPIQPQLVLAPPRGPGWAIPLWRYPGGVFPSPDGQRALVINLGGALLAWQGDPEQIVLQLYGVPGELLATVGLSELTNPARLQRTASHVMWIEEYTWDQDGWRFVTPDGQAWHIAAEDGALTQR